MDEITTRIDLIEEKDLPQILKIEQESFSNPWTLKDFIQAFRIREVLGVKLEIEREFVGFLLFCRTNADVLEIWNMAIDLKFRRMGYGTILIEHLKERLARVRCRKKICTLVSEYNLSGQLFLQSCDFRCRKIVRQYWDAPDTGGADAYSMEYCKPFIPRNRLHFGGFVNATDV